ncbi:MAG: RPA12/RPB9/RPC11 RNA polymerase family protein [Candidatus Aenigmatarchaeota archaeon]
MEFCERCGAVMLPTKKGSKNYWECRICNHRKIAKIGGLKIKTEIKHQKRRIEETREILPTIAKLCPNCEYNKAYYWTEQTGIEDKSITQLFRCVKCNYTWRED